MDVGFLRERFPVRLAVALALLVGVSAFFVGTAFGGISATTGEVHKGTPPASVALNEHEHDDDTGTPKGAHAFDEEQDYVTKAPILLDLCTTNTSAFLICPNPKSGNIDRPTSLSSGTPGEPKRRA